MTAKLASQKAEYLTLTIDRTPKGAGVLLGAYIGLMKTLFPSDATTWRMLRNVSEVVLRREDADFQDDIQDAIASKGLQ